MLLWQGFHIILLAMAIWTCSVQADTASDAAQLDHEGNLHTREGLRAVKLEHQDFSQAEKDLFGGQHGETQAAEKRAAQEEHIAARDFADANYEANEAKELKAEERSGESKTEDSDAEQVKGQVSRSFRRTSFTSEFSSLRCVGILCGVLAVLTFIGMLKWRARRSMVAEVTASNDDLQRSLIEPSTNDKPYDDHEHLSPKPGASLSSLPTADGSPDRVSEPESPSGIAKTVDDQADKQETSYVGNVVADLAKIFQHPKSSSPKAKAISVTFSVSYQTRHGEELFVVGSSKQLGEWAPSSAVPMQWTEGGKWTATIDTELPSEPSDSVVEYKYVLMSKGIDEAIWEPGENRSLCQPPYGSLCLCNDEWGAR
eukprot:gnl/MRDRNA2_/MRDRNA2_134989_c0_seq1.p1 gnl/MRDRNA2_/MRDRNA2_134989_c0~~gnl/MRDRNA2_/MRDRNA2_134989_c0_seq1.p1  ORF type:complete len:371 (+),score=82.51 gnl/MRDRNA2_/MRDRNA2_134989_c0_seq1:127-1239(+)